MKILVVSQYYYPEQFRINDITRELVARGHEVVVLTGLPNYPEGKIFKGYRFLRKRKEILNGVHIIRCFEVGRRKSSFFLFLNYISFMVSAMIKVLWIKKDYDLVFSYQLSPVTMVIPAIIAKKISGKPLYIYSCDIWPESVKNIVKSEQNILFKLAKRISNYAYRKSDHIGITSKPFFSYFMEVHSIQEQKLSYIPQHAESNYMNITQSIDNGIFDFVFLGNIGIAQDVECILNATLKVNKEYKFLVHFVGNGSFLERAKEIVTENNLSRFVVFHGRHPLEKMSDYYQLADACLITLKGDSLIGSTVPSKLQGYMAAGKPIIGAINGAANEIIKESNCGVCVEAGDYNGLAVEMEKLITNQVELKVYGQNGRNYFKKNFTLEKYIETLIVDFERLLEVEKDV